MKTLIIYKSYHHMNTEKLAKAMAVAIDAKLVKVEDIKPEELAGYDLIGFGSGIYGLRHHKSLFNLVNQLPKSDKNVFVFSTSGTLRDVNYKALKEKLAEKGYKVVGEYKCIGEYTPLGFYIKLPGALSHIGGKNLGHPDQSELDTARSFVKNLLKGSA